MYSAIFSVIYQYLTYIYLRTSRTILREYFCTPLCVIAFRNSLLFFLNIGVRLLVRSRHYARERVRANFHFDIRRISRSCSAPALYVEDIIMARRSTTVVRGRGCRGNYIGREVQQDVHGLMTVIAGRAG